MQDHKDQILGQIDTIISENVGVEVQDIQPYAEFLADYNADVDTVSAVVMEVEHQFGADGITFSPDEIANLLTVKDLHDVTLEKLNEV